MSDIILTERRDAVMTITLNRPGSLNALNADLAVAYCEAVDAAENDDGVRCVIVQGAGGHFCAGGDIMAFTPALSLDGERRADMFREFIGKIHPAINCMQRMPKPVIASVRGAAAGFGFSLAGACDMTVCSENAVFTLAYSKLGTSPDGSSTYSLPRLVGIKKAMEIAFLGERFDAGEALRLGIVNKVVADDQLEVETAALAERLATGPTRAYANTKALIYASLGNTLAQQLDMEIERFADSAAAEDFPEGIRAFQEKRKADFKGL